MPHESSTVSQFLDAGTCWLDEASRAGRVRRKSSTQVYSHMWSAFAEWAVGHGLALETFSAVDLARYVDSRATDDALTARYAWRLLRLIERVCEHHAREQQRPVNDAAVRLLAQRKELLHANDPDSKPLSEYLEPGAAARLLNFVCASSGQGEVAQRWQVLRNRASVGLMLGAGLSPGDVRELSLRDVRVDPGRPAHVKLKVGGNGNSAPRETPLAPWAAKLLNRWLVQRRAHEIPGERVFPSTKGTGKPWGKVSQYNAVNEVLAGAGVATEGGGGYRLRHTFALRQLRKGTSYLQVAQWLGITEAEATERYSRLLVATAEVV